MKKLRILIIDFLISLSILSLASIHAKALISTCFGSIRLTSVKGLADRVKK